MALATTNSSAGLLAGLEAGPVGNLQDPPVTSTKTATSEPVNNSARSLQPDLLSNNNASLPPSTVGHPPGLFPPHILFRAQWDPERTFLYVRIILRINGPLVYVLIVSLRQDGATVASSEEATFVMRYFQTEMNALLAKGETVENHAEDVWRRAHAQARKELSLDPSLFQSTPSAATITLPGTKSSEKSSKAAQTKKATDLPGPKTAPKPKATENTQPAAAKTARKPKATNNAEPSAPKKAKKPKTAKKADDDSTTKQTEKPAKSKKAIDVSATEQKVNPSMAKKTTAPAATNDTANGRSRAGSAAHGQTAAYKPPVEKRKSEADLLNASTVASPEGLPAKTAAEGKGKTPTATVVKQNGSAKVLGRSKVLGEKDANGGVTRPSSVVSPRKRKLSISKPAGRKKQKHRKTRKGSEDHDSSSDHLTSEDEAMASGNESGMSADEAVESSAADNDSMSGAPLGTYLSSAGDRPRRPIAKVPNYVDAPADDSDEFADMDDFPDMEC